MDQYSSEWWDARLGKATASKISDIMTKTKSGYGAGRKNYEAQLISERLTGTAPPSFTNAAMQWGTDTEPKARATYEFLTDNAVTEVGFVDHPTISMSGASPDGLIENGILEIKCPNTATHLDTLLNKKIPKKYQTQMFWQMSCCNADYGDFVSYDPRLPENMSMVIIRLERDNEVIEAMEKSVEEFLQGINDKLEQLKVQYG